MNGPEASCRALPRWTAHCSAIASHARPCSPSMMLELTSLQLSEPKVEALGLLIRPPLRATGSSWGDWHLPKLLTIVSGDCYSQKALIESLTEWVSAWSALPLRLRVPQFAERPRFARSHAAFPRALHLTTACRLSAPKPSRSS